jgi:hypothetical protein
MNLKLIKTMADPRRYYIDTPFAPLADGSPLTITASPSGDWIKYADFEDYKAGQRRNKNAEAITRLGVEVAELRAENERLRKAGDGLMFEGETMAHEVSWNPAPWDRVVAAWVAAKEGRDAK